MNSVEAYNELNREAKDLETALTRFLVRYKNFKEKKALVDADPDLKADVTTVGSKGDRSFSSMGTLLGKAKKIRDAANVDFPTIVASVEEVSPHEGGI